MEGRDRWESDCPLHSGSMTRTTPLCSKPSKQQLFLGTGELVRRSAANVSLGYLASTQSSGPRSRHDHDDLQLGCSPKKTMGENHLFLGI